MKTLNTKLAAAAIAVATSFTASAGIAIVDNDRGRFAIGGDVEFDFDYRSQKNIDFESGVKETNYGQGGRILLDFDGLRTLDNGTFLHMNVELLAETNGNAAIDNAFLAFGQNEWKIQAGRYEAYDMFPKGQDVFLETTGNTSDSQYGEYGYFYQMKEARGRGADAGQLMYAYQAEDLYFELGSVVGNREDFFSETVRNIAEFDASNKDAFYLRPVIAYQAGDFRISAAIEHQLISDAFVIGEKDISKRTGYGLSGNYAVDSLELNANFAYMDAVDEKNQSLGLTALYNGFGLGYFWGETKFDDNHWLSGSEGKTQIQTGYVSYEIADVMAVEDFFVYLGAYYSRFEDKFEGSTEPNISDAGARVRLKYYF
ncbi:porin [Alginatibacterium sediminis]|uniref:Porin n=1 Tax=Alginatibacterium sediminis TaxID=2164068 RepID=A0A420ECU1_9ALTE|nr:carbohydrate porin [Alginatibacterium sediminis]RKF18488.1 porin [Alginatibacterium sediminis]